MTKDKYEWDKIVWLMRQHYWSEFMNYLHARLPDEPTEHQLATLSKEAILAIQSNIELDKPLPPIILEPTDAQPNGSPIESLNEAPPSGR